MRIALINKSSKSDGEVREALAALNHQITAHLGPRWKVQAHVSLSRTDKGPSNAQGLVHLVDVADGDFHWEPGDKPVAQVMTAFTKEALKIMPFMFWTCGLSHEILEMIVDPHLTRMFPGPHPQQKRIVQYYGEICDPVQAQMYQIGGVKVVNFVLPSYFKQRTGRGRRTNFLGKRLRPFGWAKDGEVGFYDPKIDDYVTYPQAAPHKPAARKRKSKGTMARHHRYARRHRHDAQG